MRLADDVIEFFLLAFGVGLLGVVIKELRAYYKLKDRRAINGKSA